MTASDPKLLSEVLAFAGRKKFRGGILENCALAPMGKGHGNSGKPFDISTACYLKPVIAGIEKPSTRQVDIMGAVKTLKSFTAEMALGYYCAHGIGDCTYYFGTGDMADDLATTRILSYLWGIPSMAEKRRTIAGQWDETMSAIKFPDKTLRIKPANLSSVQDVNLCFIAVRDAFVTGNSGMIDQAIARTTQYPNDKKIILESQGGEDGFDFDRHYLESNQGELHVNCPHCGTSQIFNWRGWFRERGDDFVAVAPKRIPEAERESWVKENSELLKSPARRRCGFQRGPDELIKRPDGSYNKQAILKETHYECFHCGEKWIDDGEFGVTRIALDESSHYVARNPGALESHLGFNFPQWINRRIPWGDVMLDYLTCLDVKNKFGNKEPLKLWWQKRAARTWSEHLMQSVAPVVSGSYQIEGAIPDELCRVMFVDCQQDPGLTQASGQSTMGHFWYVARAIDKAGNQFQLARGYATSWDEWFKVQEDLKIANENVGIDGAFWRADVIDRAAKEIKPYTRRVKSHGKWRTDQMWFTWTVLVGDNTGKNSWKWPDGHYRSVSTMQPQYRTVTLKGQSVNIKVPLYYWSNLNVKDQLDALRRRGEGKPKFLALAREQLPEHVRNKECGDLTYENQMSAEFKTSKKNGKPFWEKSRPDNHYFDCEAGCQVLFGLGGFLGIAAAPEDSVTTFGS